MKFHTRFPRDLTLELERAGLDVSDVVDHAMRGLQEDLPGDGDLDTTSVATIPEGARAVGDFNAREAGVVAGLGIAEVVFRLVLGDEVTVSDRVPDGTTVAAGDRVMVVSGPTRGLLTAERTALNFASHLSGVATATSHWVAALEGTRARVLDTRKTLPGWRALQKYAVRCGGGVNHRFGLADMAMVKDNHVIAAGGVVPAYRAVRDAVPRPAGRGRGDRPRPAPRAARRRLRPDPARQHAARGDGRGRVDHGRPGVSLEASGGLTLERARVVAETGVDFISVGALTHSVNVFDLGLDLVEQ